MMAFTYPVMCTTKGCPHRAEYKIAARWSDGLTSELKTYALVCLDCLPQEYRQAVAKRAACRLTDSETLDEVQVFDLESARGGKPLALAQKPECLQKLNLARIEPNGGS